LIGQLVIWSGFTSGTKKLEIAKDFATKDGLIFKIKIHNGKIISIFSCIPNEEEIILFPNSKFMIIDPPKMVDGFTLLVWFNKMKIFYLLIKKIII
jgi:hypothetical protein